MKRETVSGIMLTLLLIGMLTLTFNIQPVKAEPRTWTVDDDRPADFHTIQEAINTAGPGDTIFVYSGTYYERVEIDAWKRINLVGEDKDTTIIDANGYTQAIYVHWNAKNITISGFTVKNAYQGILLLSDFSTVSDNIVTNNWNGIVVRYSNGHIISDNKIVSNRQDGIYMRFSDNNKFYNNIIDNNGRCGIWSGSSVNNIFAVNILSNNGYGIWSGSSFKNNKFYHSNFIENSEQVRMYEPQYANIWDISYPSGGNYWSDYSARYPLVKDEYQGENQDVLGSDGIWDSPYEIDVDNQDRYPLVEPWSPLPRTIDELKTEIEKCWLEGEIDNQGIVKSLIAKLNVAQKLVDKGKIDEAKSILEDDFIPKVQNLSGIHITPETGDILIQSAEYLLSHL